MWRHLASDRKASAACTWQRLLHTDLHRPHVNDRDLHWLHVHDRGCFALIYTGLTYTTEASSHWSTLAACTRQRLLHTDLHRPHVNDRSTLAARTWQSRLSSELWCSAAFPRLSDGILSSSFRHRTVVTSSFRQLTTPRRTTLPVQFICCLCGCLSGGVELTPRLHERGACRQGDVQTTPEDVFVCLVLMHIAY